jgi:putative hemolysin
MVALLADHIFELVALVALLGGSGFFSGSETALFSLTREQLRRYERGESRAEGLIVRLLHDPGLLLATVLVGNTAVNVLFFSLSFTLAHAAHRQVSAVAGGAVGVASLLLIIVFGEVAPKGVAVAHSEAFAHRIAIPMYLFQRAAWPAAYLCVKMVQQLSAWLERYTEREVYVNADELKMLVEMAKRQQVLAGTAPAMMQDVVDLKRTRVKQIMVPRVDIAAFRFGGGRDRFIELVRQTHHNRYLVYTNTMDDISTALLARDVYLNPQAELRSLQRPVVFVPETKTVEDLLRQFREQMLDFAVVVDEYGGTAGMVTIEDVIEEVFGEIEDEYDEPETEVRSLGQNSYLLSGNLSVESWRDIFGHDLPPADADTLGGVVTALLGRMPKAGDTVTFRGLELTVRRMRRRRVGQVLLRLLPASEEEAP